jgi:hypothetical protein
LACRLGAEAFETETETKMYICTQILSELRPGYSLHFWEADEHGEKYDGQPDQTQEWESFYPDC